VGADDSYRTLRKQYEDIKEELDWIEQFVKDVPEDGPFTETFILSASTITGDTVKLGKKVKKLADVIWFSVPAARKAKRQQPTGKGP
jgi:hypothetical protein